MSDTDDLLAIADELAKLKGRFVDSASESFLKADDQSHFEAIVTEAKAIIGGSLGHMNDFTLAIINSTANGVGGFFGGPSYVCIGEVEGIIRGAVRQINRKDRAPKVPPIGLPNTPPYVNLARIEELKALPKKQWDFAKLIQLCIELNIVSSNDEATYATAMLVRAIVDHVPPIFGMNGFSQVADNYAGTSSFKGSMQHLNRSMRNIADGILHEQIRQRESLPSPQQVDFRQDLDRLLGEIVRISKP
ncbi:hypothetical protein ABIF97_008220 [Bradyrhizobium japonicum]